MMSMKKCFNPLLGVMTPKSFIVHFPKSTEWEVDGTGRYQQWFTVNQL